MRSGYALGRPVDEIVVPDTVQDVIMARLDRLADEPRHALQTASVIGREFTPRLLETHDRRRSDRRTPLRQLKTVQLIFERSLYPELVFMFKHALTHEVAYGSLLAGAPTRAARGGGRRDARTVRRPPPGGRRDDRLPLRASRALGGGRGVSGAFRREVAESGSP